MRKFKVLYSDKTFSDRPEKFETKPYDHKTAEELRDMLALMGCTDFQFIPIQDERKVA